MHAFPEARDEFLPGCFRAILVTEMAEANLAVVPAGVAAQILQDERFQQLPEHGANLPEARCIGTEQGAGQARVADWSGRGRARRIRTAGVSAMVSTRAASANLR